MPTKRRPQAGQRRAEVVQRSRCPGRTKTGRPCGMAPLESGFCWTHDPARARDRADARRRGGFNRRTPDGVMPASVSLRSVADIQQQLELAYAALLLRENSVQRARAAGYLLGVAADLLKVGELADRLAAIEARLNGGPPPLRNIA